MHLDYLYIGPSYNGLQYILVEKDGLSGYCELVTSISTHCATAAKAILDWGKRFIYQSFSKVRDYFTLSYCPWSNGVVERVNVDVLVLLKAVLIELLWPIAVPIVQHIINNTPSESLGGLAPLIDVTN